MNIYERLKQEHDEARELFEQLADTSDRAVKKRSELFEKLKLDLWVHHKLEEAVFYSVLAEHRETRDEAYEAINEHHVANGLLEELDSMPVDSAAWHAKLGTLKELAEHHMEEEEEEVFEEARSVLSDEQAEQIGKAMADRKKVVLAALQPIELKAS